MAPKGKKFWPPWSIESVTDIFEIFVYDIFHSPVSNDLLHIQCCFTVVTTVVTPVPPSVAEPIDRLKEIYLSFEHMLLRCFTKDSREKAEFKFMFPGFFGVSRIGGI